MRGYCSAAFVALILGINACTLLYPLEDFSTALTGDRDSGHDGSEGGTDLEDSGNDGRVGTDGVSDAPPPTDLLSCNATDLVAYWSFTEGQGLIVKDCSPNGFNGGSGGNADSLGWGKRTTSGGAEAGALEFTGLGGWIVYDQNVSARMTGDFTISFWLRLDESPTNYVVVIGHHNGADWEVGLSADQVSGGTHSDDDVFVATPNVSEWKHFALVRRSGVLAEWYVGGVRRVTKTTVSDGGRLSDAAPVKSNSDVRTGVANLTDGWKAAVSDMRLYSRALTGDEIFTLSEH